MSVTVPDMPISRFIISWLVLVSCVTAIMSGIRSDGCRLTALAAPSSAAAIIAVPPAACTLNISTPSRVRLSAPPRTVLGISCILTSRKTE
ncbi:hypothetical protein D3C84_1197940 [compost metagenome]